VFFFFSEISEESGVTAVSALEETAFLRRLDVPISVTDRLLTRNRVGPKHLVIQPN